LEAGLRFEHDTTSGVSLDEAIRQAASKDRGALPLLSFLLDQLWQRRSDTGVLTFAAYRELGELAGAIGSRAEDVFQAQPEAVQKELVPLLRELVTIEGGKPVSRTAPLSRFPEGSPRRSLVEALLDPQARLLVSDGHAGRAQLRLAHEALLSHWKRATNQIADDARDLELRGRLEQEAESWRTAPPQQKKGRVISGLPLAEARALLARWGTEWPAEVRDFVAASRRAERRRRFQLWGLVAAAPPAVALVAVTLWVGLLWWGVRQVEAEWAAEQQFVRIPTGCFQMGSPDGNGTPAEPGRYTNEGPVHQVCVTAFDLAKFEVTRGEWSRVMIFPNTPDPSHFKSDDRLPVELITWIESQRFLWLMSFFGHGHYRLPTESEWEYAARAGTTTSRYWGDNIDDGCTFENMANRRPPSTTGPNCEQGPAAPVGWSKKPNPWGLYDMLGNVMNWVEDCYVSSYSQTPTDGSPNTIGSCGQRVIRGGSWINPSRTVRAAYRFSSTSDSRRNFIGFRVARTINP
jgi:formylglycine-generating enzyme required for sulfatase activity